MQAAETGIQVLKGLATLGGRAGLSALATRIGESPAKVHRYLVSLMEGGLVAQDASTQQYYLGTAAIEIGLAAMRQIDPVRYAEASLVRLRESLQVTCFIAVMGNLGPTILRFEEPGLPVTVNVRAGSVLPVLWSATGRAFLGMAEDASVAMLAQAELAAAPPARRATLDPDDPIGALQRQVRQAGCASVRDTNLPGISAVAAAIHDYTGRVVAVLTALGASGGFDAGIDGANARAVRAEVDAVSRALGYEGVGPREEAGRVGSEGAA
ncbi:IclR family transcriptional regulator [Verticiella sediminum]